MPHGWIILDKPVGLGSTQAVAAVKRNLRQAGYGKKVKVGHGGTLDPLAEGVLPIAIGEATKLCGRMLDASKIYAFTIRFGVETDTLDAEGAVTAHSDHIPSVADVAGVLPRFTGAIEQMPPAYSALKVDGQRAYDLARAGEEVVLKSRAVTIRTLDLAESEADAESVTLVAHVSKGTYIRSLARDIAIALGTVGHVTMLRRLKAGPFRQEQAISLDKLNEIGTGAPLEDVILPLEAGLDDIPALSLDPEAARAVRQGRVIFGLPQGDGLYWARSGAIPVALMELSGGDARVVRGFNLSDVAE
ncbi:tRNA pseudouridine synthase B [Caenibius tardaugens NBRC 16725]|uniref:tRNA pseudouridine synthase B n=1 Tax=Caenibius tardaugens NBRC 16725 TaxID=1219035 RepID=U2YIE3_9SPHN|nr:tRNA pseudouridine(55) synthase TruB [Caenibius tardaugens]AZI36950.1 tRNA pseudouridine(55) synthase TruB [Caenibius tardaugens NBRC 16725]GAD47837.1 tRNA pseudouridine synthase B [Caenibius tardaugens NBRC 16725]